MRTLVVIALLLALTSLSGCRSAQPAQAVPAPPPPPPPAAVPPPPPAPVDQAFPVPAPYQPDSSASLPPRGDQAAPSLPDSEEEVVVTGSRIVRRGSAQAAPSLPAAQPSQFDVLKDFVARMQSAAGALRASPARVESGARVDVTLTISPSASEAELLRRATEPGAVVDAGAARIAARMRAALIVPEGATVAIVGSEERAISDTEDTVWRWIVTPTQVGDLPLAARLTAPVIVDGKETPYDVRTFEARVTVFVTPISRVQGFVERNWKWLWATLLVPLAGWLRKRWTSRRETRA